MVISARIH